MISHIKIENFQCLKSVELVLGKLTVIVGSTNVGKSAFVRAVKAVVENRRGDSFINDFSDGCTITISVGRDAIAWLKMRTKSGVYYKYENNQWIVAYQEHVAKILKLPYVELVKGIKFLPNFQNQLDAPFLIADSDVYKSKVLGEITNAVLILMTNSVIKRNALQNATILSIRKKDVVDYQQELVKFVGLDKIDEELIGVCLRLHVIECDLNLSKKHIEIQIRLIEAVLFNNRLNDGFGKIHPFVKALNELTIVGRKAEEIDLLKSLAKSLIGIESELSIARIWKKKADLLSSVPSFGLIESRLSDLVRLRTYVEYLGKEANIRDTAQSELNNYVFELKTAETNLQYIREELKICPLCEGALVP